MVSILPSDRSGLDVLGRYLGQGLSQNLPGAIQRGYERGLGLNAIDQLQNKLNAANQPGAKQLSPLDIALEFARVGAVNPALERSLGPLYQAAISQTGASGIAGGLQGDQNSPQQTISPTPQTVSNISQETDQPQPKITPPQEHATARNIDEIANQYIGEVRPDLVDPASQYGAIATFDSMVKQDLTPEEEGRLRQQLMDKYKNPNVVNSVADRVREGVKNKYNEALAKYGFDKERQGQIKEKWDEFARGTPQRISPFLEKYEGMPATQDILTNKYNKYAQTAKVNETPQDMHSKAMALLQNDINKLDALHALPSMPPLRAGESPAKYIDQNKSIYKDMADAGFTQALKEDAINNKDMGNEEFHSLIWGDQTNKNLLNDLHKYKAPQEYRKELYKTPQYYNKNYKVEREKYLGDISSVLKRMGPNDDLILARSMILDNGGEVKDFLDALNMAQEKGLKLSEFQRGQLQEAGIPRTPPLWELFSEGGPSIGPFKFLNWGPFINYLRGKR